MERTQVTAWPILDDQLFLAVDYVATPSRRFAGGACDDSPEGAEIRAHSEATERASLIENGPDLVISRDAAVRRGLSLVVPRDIPHHVLDEAEDWVPARHSVTGEDAGVPADVVLLGRVSTRLRVLPWRQSSVGAAAHPDRDTAGIKGILECLERYAIRRVWDGTATLARATDRLHEHLPAGLAAAFAQRQLVAHAWIVREAAPLQVTLVLVGRTDRAQATFGAGVGFDQDDALAHALREAVMVRASLGSRANRHEREFQRGARSARHQEAFLAYLRDLEAPDPDAVTNGDASADESSPATAAGLSALVEKRFGVAPLLVDVPSVNANSVVKAVIPAAEFLTPRSGGDYIFAPGYLD